MPPSQRGPSAGTGFVGLTTSERRSLVTGAEEWLINADEPNVLDYNVNFKSAGQIVDITAPTAPVLLDPQASVRLTLDDNGSPGAFADAIGITVWNRQGQLWFSSNWDGTKTIEQPIAAGSIRVRRSPRGSRRISHEVHEDYSIFVFFVARIFVTFVFMAFVA